MSKAAQWEFASDETSAFGDGRQAGLKRCEGQDHD